MKPLRAALPLALVFVAAALADGPGTLGPLRGELNSRIVGGEYGNRATRVMEAAVADIADDTSLAEEAATARRSGTRLLRTFRRDPPLRDLVRVCADSIAAETDIERTSLGAAIPTLGAAEATTLRAGLGAAARLLGRAASSRGTTRRLDFLSRACRRLEDARLASGAVAVPGAPPQPDFALRDDNRRSSSYRRRVSPRSRLGSVSAWYFGHST